MENDTLKAVWRAVWPTTLVVTLLLALAGEARAEWWDAIAYVFGWLPCNWTEEGCWWNGGW